MHRRILLILLFLTPNSLAAATLRGKVADARTGEPIARAKVSIASISTLTDDGGSFSFEGIGEGETELRATTVGYALFKRTVTIAATNADLTIALQQDGDTRTDTITVSAGPYDIAGANTPSQRTLNKSEIESLSMVLLGDPLRAAQALPGVTANNDLRAEFSMRGAGYSRIGIWVDGVMTEGFVHSANLSIGGSASTEKLSISVIDSNTVSEMALDSGAYPPAFGGNTAGILSIRTRDGNFVRTTGRIVTGLLGVGAAVDRPFAKRKASWLLAGRSSYADYVQRLLEKLTGTGRSSGNDPDASINFSDAQAKVVYNASPAHQFGLGVVYGAFVAEEGAQTTPPGLDHLTRVDSKNLLANARWTYTAGPHLLTEARVFTQRNDSLNKNRNHALLDDLRRQQEGGRADVTWLSGSQQIEAGTYIRRVWRRKVANSFTPSRAILEQYREDGNEQSAYLQDTWRRETLSVTVGGRAERSGLAGATALSPRGALSWALHPGWTFRGGAGSYVQFPEFDQLFGYFGNRALRAERAHHFNLSLERMAGARGRILLEVYDREDHNQAFALNEVRLVAGQPAASFVPWRNVVEGYARGAEITIQRRSANRLAGWVSYGLMTTRYRDRTDGLSWVSDFDQRHTVNAFGTYRLKPTVNVSAQWRYGSGLPWTGFTQRTATGYGLGPERNTVRLPAYSRLDLRVNKAFVFHRWKMTLAGEVLNVLDRKNYFVESTDLLRVQRTGRFSSGLDDSIPLFPSISITIAF